MSIGKIRLADTTAYLLNCNVFVKLCGLCNIPYKEGTTALMLASEQGLTEIVQMLLADSRVVDVNVQNNVCTYMNFSHCSNISNLTYVGCFDMIGGKHGPAISF